MSNREFVMLAHVYKPDKAFIANWYVSLKLDGQRCFWDGGISRGLAKKKIPYANNNRDERYVEPPIATGLWSRYGNVIHAPEWFLNQLPKNVFMDGELYMGRQRFQETRKIISTLEPGKGWKDVKFRVFDLPSPLVAFTSGFINNPNWKGQISSVDCERFFDEYKHAFDPQAFISRRFDETLSYMQKYKSLEDKNWSFLNQLKLPSNDDAAKEKVAALLMEEVDKKGEGLMLRAPQSMWFPKRSQHILKVKPFEDDECVISGYVAGEGKYLGMIGSLLVYWKDKQFQLSGLTDEMRRFADEKSAMAAKSMPGHQVPAAEARHFKKGQIIRFRYRELTNDGLPREARFWDA